MLSCESACYTARVVLIMAHLHLVVSFKVV